MTKPLALVTGATSGIGRLAAISLARQRPDWTVLASGRGRDRTAAEAIGIAREASAENVAALAADLASLASVRTMADALIARGQPIALLLLAAGRQATEDGERSADNYECTFAVNVLANVALIDALVAHGRTPERIVMISSGTHNPDRRAGLPTPRHADPALLANPKLDAEAASDKPWTRGSRAYSASKLALAMLAYVYAREKPAMRIDAIDPQLVPGTGLARHQSTALRFLWRFVMPAFVPLVPFMNRPKAVADATVALALDTDLGAGNGRYFEVRRGRLVEARSSAMSYDTARQTSLVAGIRHLIQRSA